MQRSVGVVLLAPAQERQRPDRDRDCRFASSPVLAGQMGSVTGWRIRLFCASRIGRPTSVGRSRLRLCAVSAVSSESSLRPVVFSSLMGALAQQPSPCQVWWPSLIGEGGDGERDGGIGPPEAEGGVEREAREHAGGEVGAEQVLGAFAGGGAGAEALADAVLGVAEQGHDDDAGDR